MITQIPGKTYPAHQRGLPATNQFKRYSSFNADEFNNLIKNPLGKLDVLKEELLGGGEPLFIAAEQATHVIILPITGSITLNGTHGGTTLLGLEEILVITIPAHNAIQLTNLDKYNTVKFLHIRLKAYRAVSTLSWVLSGFQSCLGKNGLIPVLSADICHRVFHHFPFSLKIGRFHEWQVTNYNSKYKDSIFLAYVVDGAFQIGGRLLQEKDCLALWNTKEVNLEALSNNTLIIVMEIFQAGEIRHLNQRLNFDC